MSNELPLYYAIMKHFENGKPDCNKMFNSGRFM